MSELAHFAPATLARAASGRSLPTLAVTLAYAVACGADPAEWQRRWQATAWALRPSFRPRRPEQAGSGVLPAAAADFTGRVAALRELRSLLTSGAGECVPIVNVFGRSGIGKTTLAVRVAHELAHHFPDGCVFLSATSATLEPSAEALSRRLLLALGVPVTDIPAGHHDRVVVYRRISANLRWLAVFDDVSDAAAIRSLIPAAPGAALVTSRSPLTTLEGGRYLPLGVLSSVDSRALLARIVGAERMADEEAAARIVRACDGFPLAIRIVGARLATKPHWPLARMAGVLADKQHRLDELATADLAVRSSIAISYEQLCERARKAFRLLASIGTPEVTEWLAAAVLDSDTSEAERCVESMADAGLLEMRRPCRGMFHDLVQIFGQERAQAEDSSVERNQALQRALNTATHAASAADSHLHGGVRGEHLGRNATACDCSIDTAQQALSWLRSEQSNLMSLFYRTISEYPREAIELAMRMTAYFELDSLYETWRDVAESLLSQPNGPVQRAYGLYMSGVVASELGKAKLAIDTLLEARQSLDAVGEQRARAYADIYLANNLHGVGDVAGSTDYVGRAQATFQHIADEQGLAYAGLVLGIALISQARLDEATSHLQAAAARFIREGHCQGAAHARRALAHVCVKQVQYRQAVEHYLAALDLIGPEPPRTDYAIICLGLADALKEQGSYTAARSWATKANAALAQIDNQFLQTRAHHLLARIDLDGGRPQPAIPVLEAAARSYEQAGARLWQARAYRDIGEAHLALGQDMDAKRVWVQALTLLAGTDVAERVDLRSRIRAIEARTAVRHGRAD